MNDQRDRWRIRLEAYLAGAMPEDERRSFETETLADAELADEFYAAVALDEAMREAAAAAPADEPTTSTAWWRRRIWLVALPAAAAVAFLVVLPRGPAGPDPSPTEPVLRGEETGFRGLAPAGEVATPPERFVWTAAEGAVRYRLELHDAAGRRQLTRVVTDTFLVVAPETRLELEIGGEPWWRVVPVAADGRELRASDPVFFRLHRP